MFICLTEKCNHMLFFVIVCCFQVIHSVEQFNCDGELIFAQTICDHGDSTIGESYPNDPYKSREKYWPEGYHQLTKVGKQQMFELGKQLRERYKRLLVDDKYGAYKAYFFATDDDRVLASAETCAAGIFPPSGYEVWNKNINWQPIPIHSTPIDRDNIVAFTKKCDRYDAMNSLTSSMMFNKVLEKYDQLIEFMEINSGKQLSTLKDLNSLYQTLYVERCRGYKLPQWAQLIMESDDFVKVLSNSNYIADTYTTEMKKFKSGFLLKNILDNFTKKSRSTLSPNFSLKMNFGQESGIIYIKSHVVVYIENGLFLYRVVECVCFFLYLNRFYC